MPLQIAKSSPPAAPPSNIYDGAGVQLPGSGPWAVDGSESVFYEVRPDAQGDRTTALVHRSGNPGVQFAEVVSPGSGRLSRAQFANAQNTVINILNSSAKVQPTSSSSRRRIVTTNDGSIGIRG